MTKMRKKKLLPRKHIAPPGEWYNFFFKTIPSPLTEEYVEQFINDTHKLLTMMGVTMKEVYGN